MSSRQFIADSKGEKAMFKLKASVFGLIFSLALLHNVFAAETAPAPPVIVTHTFTGYSTTGNTVSLDLTIHVANPGDTYLSNVTLTFVPMPPFISGRSTLNVGGLAPRQSADFPLHVQAMAMGMDMIAHKPLFFAGKYDDARGTLVEYPVTSRPGNLSEKLYLQSLQNRPSPSGVAAPLTLQPSALAAAVSPPTEPGNFLFKWGNEYPSDPRSVAVDSAGDIYVADTGSDRIQVFDRYGDFVRSWGGYGTGDGQFEFPEGVAVDSGGNVYVADTYNNRIQVFDSGGNFLMAWGSNGTGNGQFDLPWGVAVDSGGNVYVADAYNNRIQVFDSNGNFVRKWGSLGTGNGQFDRAFGVAVDSGGNVYVVDNLNNRIQVFDSSGNFVRTWGSEGTGDGQFSNPEGVAVDSAGNVYVSDSINRRIQVFDGGGNFVRSWGGYGSGNGQLDSPYGVAVDSSGSVYVADAGNSRIQVFTGTGTYLSKIGDKSADGSFCQLSGVAVDSGGNIYVADTGNSRIQVFDSGGHFLRTWGGYGSGDGQFEYPQGVAVDANGNIFVADCGNNRVAIFDSTGAFIRNIEGSLGAGNAPLTGPFCVAVDANGNVYVGDSDGFGRLLVFDDAGTFVRTGAGSYQPFPRGIAVDANSNVYVPSSHDSGGAIDVFDNAGTFLRVFGSGQVRYFGNGIAVDASSNVYVTDWGYPFPDGRVLLFDTTGSFKGVMGSEGSHDGQFHFPTGVAANASGTIVYVADNGNNRIEAFVGYGTPSFAVSFIAGAHGSISGTTSQVVTSGQNTTAVTAVPDSGYRFVNWTGDNGFAATTDNPLTLTDVTASHTITANFAANTPLTTTATVNGTPGANGWYVSDVGITFSALEAKKICAKLDNRAMAATAGSTATLSITSEGRHTVIYYAVDSAGSQEPLHTLNIDIDKTPPAIKITGARKGAVFVLGRKLPTMNYTARDKICGVASQDAALTGGNADHAGIFTYTVHASDNAGNTVTRTSTYSVRYVFRGLSPRRGKKFTAGSVVPVTFGLKDAKGNYIPTASAALMLISPDGAQVPATSGTNTGNVFRYDPVTNRYVYDLDTAGLAAGKWRLQVLLDDGSPVKTTYIKFQ
jgi:tripartite motif-containing protein 71